MVKRLISQLAIYYCRDILLCEREAAIVARGTLKMGLTGMIPLEQAVERTVSGLDIQIQALEVLMDLPKDS